MVQRRNYKENLKYFKLYENKNRTFQNLLTANKAAVEGNRKT